MTNWLEWARELHALAQSGLYCTKDIYDEERYERIKEMSHQMMSVLANTSPQVIAELRLEDSGYQTPKIDTRGAVWKDDQILLVQEKDGLWALPGGWMDVTETISSNVLKEIYEESGMEAEVVKLVSLQDRNLHNPGQNPYTIVKVFVECEYKAGSFKENSETMAAKFFSVDELPELMVNKTSKEQIHLCYQARQQGKNWQVTFD